MYNRYIPQEDGTYARNRMQDPSSAPRKASPSPPPHTVNDINYPPKSQQEPEYCQPPQRQSSNGPGFLKQLLPKGFDTGDLIIILLLLLMAGDCEEDRNNAILTIALYFLM